MVGLTSLWLPIVLSAVIVFIASSIVHMVLPYHRSDYRKLPDEDALLEAMRKAGLSPGNYSFPLPAHMKEMRSPEMLEKYGKGPVGMVNVLPSGPPAMTKFLLQWFVFTLFIGIFVAYLTGRTVAAGTDYILVFRVSGTAAFLAYSASDVTNSIWRGQAWSTTWKNVLDGLLYSLLTGGVFGWLWPR